MKHLLSTRYRGRYLGYSMEQERGHSSLDLRPLHLESRAVQATSASETPGQPSHGTDENIKI